MIKSFKKTIDRFINNNGIIARELIISLSPKDDVDGKINIKKLTNYLDYRCKFDQC